MSFYNRPLEKMCKYLAVCVGHKSGAQTKVASHFSAVSRSLLPDPTGKLTHSCNLSSRCNFHDGTIQKDDSNLFHYRLPAIKQRQVSISKVKRIFNFSEKVKQEIGQVRYCSKHNKLNKECKALLCRRTNIKLKKNLHINSL